MTRWELLRSDEYIDGTIELIVSSKQPVKRARRLLGTFFKKYRDELLHGDQGAGCSNKKCKVCYPHRKSQSVK